MTLLPQEVDDPDRLAAVERLGLVGLPYEERFDRITRTAQRLLDVPMAFLNLVAAESLWVTSCVGFDDRQVDRNVAFCSHAIASPAALIVPDATKDPRFRDNPMVVAAPYIRSYAGRPLRGPSGHVVGTLCVTGLEPRAWSSTDVETLEDLATWAETELARGDVERRLTEGEQLRQQYAQVLAHAGQGIVGVDDTGQVVVANPAALDLTGYPDLLGRQLHATLHARTADGAACSGEGCPLGTRLLEPQRTLRHRDVLWRSDARALPVQLSAAPILDGEHVSGAVVVFDDVTEQQTVERLKDEFVSVVSHELRTPLTSLRGSLGLLAGGVLGELSPQGKQMADVAVSSTERLVRLVDDILDLERLVAGQVVLQRRAQQLRDIASTSMHAVQGLADAKQVELRTAVQDVELWADGDRAVQVLVNLLGNAVKFSAPGSGVELRGALVDGAVVLEVQDSGRGIPEDQLERVFDRFAQVDASDSRAHGGSGLGLAIARNVVEAHGGQITATSRVGVGTTFTVVLPQRRPGSTPRSPGRRADDLEAPS